MNAEIELKLLVSHEFAAFLSREMASFSVLSQTQQILGNCYYDTTDYFFSKMNMGLRVRTLNERFILTLKTDGKVIGGLHMRPEYELELSCAQPHLQGLAKFDDLSLSRSLAELEADLKPIFSTDFLRQTWEIELGNGAMIEIALDQGEIEADGRSEAICEAEFELKHGDIDDLLTFVEHLSLADGIRLGAASKAKRGYRLAGVLACTEFDWRADWQQYLHWAKQCHAPNMLLQNLLTYEQKLVEYYSEQLDTPSRYDEEFVLTALQAFSALYGYYHQHESLLWQVLQQHAGSRIRMDSDMVQELIELNQRFLTKILEWQKLASNHWQLSAQKLQALLHHGGAVKRHIGLIKLTLK